MSEEEKIKEIREKVVNLVTRNFSITKCPEKVYERFVKFCREETNDNYSMGLKSLLDARDANIKEILLFEQYMELNERVCKLEQAKETPEPEKKEKNKTFGSGASK